MATDVVLPALGMAQDSGKIVRWLKAEGEQVTKGEPLAEVETDKATIEIEAPVSGLLARVGAREGAEVPVGQVIAAVLTSAEFAREQRASSSPPASQPAPSAARQAQSAPPLSTSAPVGAALNGNARPPAIAASLLASRIAAEHHVDLSQVRSSGQRVQKADVLAYLQGQQETEGSEEAERAEGREAAERSGERLPAASPKARRLAREQGKDLGAIVGSGPQGAVLAADILTAQALPAASTSASTPAPEATSNLAIGTIWRLMAERTAQSWQEVPHFYLGREVHADRMIAWRDYLMRERGLSEITYTDLLVKSVALALRQHPRLNATWSASGITLLAEIHLGLAVAVDEGLVVPVIHQADRLDLRAIVQQRQELVARARAGKLRPQDLSGGSFTISNLGMYGVDTFNAILNQPQAAILAVGRIAERVVPVNGQPAVRPMMALTLSCDHRTIDGARGAQFLQTLASFIEEPLNLLTGF
jgi:pyruvate dehydrogenase E2 component (dihydrolipoamide acetyltransferase)